MTVRKNSLKLSVTNYCLEYGLFPMNEFVHGAVSTGGSNELNARLFKFFQEASIPVLPTRDLSDSEEDEKTLSFLVEEILI
ncbi:uncharacterized protein KGF55_000675 [Candida pseudojiufengensis]|uniref:uncharacterized protein n=1 Tax=Candida pseudojiufengensis TaxID=497109 RepID=UPI002224A2E4|nr:uncharacterized protein KGF55_000675 [Candida pseudojiufengensis]KAI5966366.1 hypothetical protein KGF55_000675 [Candida pseudojiufengensis]